MDTPENSHGYVEFTTTGLVCGHHMVFPNSGAILHVTMWSVVVPGSQHNSSPTPSGVGQESDMSFAFLGNRSPLLIQHLVPRHSMGPPKNTCFFCFIYQMTLGRFLLFAFNVCLFFFFLLDS